MFHRQQRGFGKHFSKNGIEVADLPHRPLLTHLQDVLAKSGRIRAANMCEQGDLETMSYSSNIHDRRVHPIRRSPGHQPHNNHWLPRFISTDTSMK
jgi:hypothetical protein